MATTLTASNCPAIQGVPSSLLDITAASPLTGFPAVQFGLMSSTDYNKQIVVQNLLGRFGAGGAYCVLYGLALSAGSGLTLNIAAGQANIDGPVQIPINTMAMPDNHTGAGGDRIWIWLAQAGTLSYVTNSLAPPAGNQLCLGSVTTASGAITAVDNSGVVVGVGGVLFRSTADTTFPSDAPSSSVTVYTKTPTGTYHWDGAAHGIVPSAANPLPIAAGGTGGSSGTSTRVYSEQPSGTVNGSNTSFTLAHTPLAGKLMVWQTSAGSAVPCPIPTTQFSFTGTALTLSVAPVASFAPFAPLIVSYEY